MIGIRPAERADVPQIAHIIRAARKHSLPYLPDLHTPEEDRAHFGGTVFNEDTILVAEEDGAIVGFCAFKEDWLDHLYILPQHQNKGVGRALLNQAKHESAQLHLWVFQKNTRAITFYENNGFDLVKQTDGHDNEEKEPDALYIWKGDSAPRAPS